MKRLLLMGLLALAFGTTLSAQPDVFVDTIFLEQDTIVPDSGGSSILLEDSVDVFADSVFLQVKTTTDSSFVYWRFSGDFDGDGNIDNSEIFEYGPLPPGGEPNGGILITIPQLKDRSYRDLVEVSLQVVTAPDDFETGGGQEIGFSIIVYGGGRLAVGNSTSGSQDIPGCPKPIGSCYQGRIKDGRLEFYLYNIEGATSCTVNFNDPDIEIDLTTPDGTETCSNLKLSDTDVSVEVYNKNGTLVASPTNGIFSIGDGGSARIELPISAVCTTNVATYTTYDIYLKLPYAWCGSATADETASRLFCFGCEMDIYYDYHSTSPLSYSGPFHLPDYSRAKESIVLSRSVSVEPGDIAELEVDPSGIILVKKFECDSLSPGQINLGAIARKNSFFYAHRDDADCAPLLIKQAPDPPPVTAASVPVSKSISRLEIYPNPFQDEFTLSLFLHKDERVKVVLFDLYGRIVKPVIADQQYSAGDHSLNIQLNDLPDGMYYCRVRTGDQIKTISVVKNR